MSDVHDKMQTGASHFITQTNQDSSTALSLWKTKYQLKNQTVIVNRRANIPQLVMEHLKTLTLSRNIKKILHVNVKKLLLYSDITSILIVLKNVNQTILSFHSSEV